jgi:tetratricopeptide (TPR) repeat protein
MLRSFVALCLIFLVSQSFSDETFNKLFDAGKYKEAIEYADQKIPPTSRTAAIWVKIAQAHEKTGLIEKALASYMVSWRMNPKDYASLLGAARIYNKLKQYDQAVNMAKKALEQKFTGEASWEYARACIELQKPAEAKKALEKVIETDPNNIVANRELGIIYYNSKKYVKAVPLLKKAYANKPDANVAFQIGKSYLKINDVSSAVEYLKKALEKKKTLYQASLMLARAYFKMNNYAEASAEYAKVRGKISFEAADYFNLARAYEKAGQKAKAIEAYRSAIRNFGSSKDKDAITSRHKVGVYDLENKKYNSAVEQFEFIASADPKAKKVEDIYFLLADAYSGTKSYSKAIRSLEKAVALDAKNIEAYARLADLYTKNNMPDKAKTVYEKMMSLSPNDPNVYLVLGNYNFKAKNYSKALKLYVRSNSLKESVNALEGIALSASKLNEWDKALDAAESVVTMDKSRTKSRIVLAEALMKSQSYSEAKVHLEVLAAKTPSKKKYWYNLSKCYEKLNDQANLIKIDKKIITIDKMNVKSRMRYAKYLLKKGDGKGAYKIFIELSMLTPKDPVVFKHLYEIAIRKKDKASAINYLKKYLPLNPNDAQSQKLLGDLYYEKKNFDGALTAYRKALQIDPGIKGFYKQYAEIVIAKGQQDEVIKALNGVIKSGEADVGTYTTLGMIYLKKKKYTDAKEMYQQALMMEPQNFDALAALGECQAKLGDVSSAVITYEQAIMMNPKAGKEYKELGDLYVKQGKGEQAIKSYKSYLSKVPGDEEVSQKVGNHLYDKKDYKNAAKYLGAVKGSRANDFEHQRKLGESYYHSKSYKKAIDVFTSLATRQPKMTTLKNILLMKAKSYENLKDINKALLAYDDYSKIKGVRDPEVDYKRASLREKSNPSLAKQIYLQNTKSYPTDSRNFLKLGLIYSQNKSTYSSAIQMLEKAVAVSGKDQKLWLEIAKLYGKLGQEDKELAAYKKYISLDPQNLDANIRMGIILMKKGKTSEGMVYLETANTFSPNNFEVMVALAGGYLKTNRTREAVNLLDKAKAKKPNDVEIRKKLFEAYSKLGDTKRALGEIKGILQVNRGDPELLMLYANLLYKEGDIKDAENAIEDIRATNPENIGALMLLAKIQRSRKKYNEAIETYKEVIFIDANYAPALYERAETYMQQNKPQWAERFYYRALRANPKYALAELGMANICKMRKDKTGYLKHLKAAKRIDPNDPKIKEECKKAKIY